MSANRRRVAWLGVLLLLAAAWRLVPRPAADDERAPAVRVVLVDASASVVRRRPAWLPWARRLLEDEARVAAEAGQELAVVAFAEEVALAQAPVDARAFVARLRGQGGEPPFDPRAGAGGELRTRLADALALAAEVAADPARAPGVVVVAGTERFTGADPTRALLRLRRAGVVIERRSVPPPELADLAVTSLELPRAVEAGAPLAARVGLRWSPGAAPVLGARLAVRFGRGDAPRLLEVPLELPPGGGELHVTLDLGAAAFGRTEVRAEASLVRAEADPPAGGARGVAARRGDPLPENDALEGAVHAGGELVIALCAERGRLDEARRWLAPTGRSTLAGIQILSVALEDLPARLDEADALVTWDLHPRELPELLVASFVREGGGWLATSGWRFLEEWIPGEPPAGLHALLPAEPAPLERDRRDVVLLVDGSGSMEGEPFDTVRSAALDLVAAALPSDEVSLRFFTARLQPGHAIKPRTEGANADRGAAQEAARRLIGLHVPSGETHILASLEAFAAERSGDSDEALALLLTDGLEREAMPDVAGRARRVRERLTAARVDLRPIAIGAKADLGFLARLARPGEEVAQPADLDALRAIFRREVTGAQWRSGEALELARAPAAPGSLAEEVDGPVAADPFDDVPPLSRFVRNELRPGAEAVWSGDEGEPVLAVTRVGRGRTALFASLPGPGWAPAWASRAGLGEPSRMAGALRWLGRGPERGASGPELALEREALELGGLGPDWPAVVEGDLLADAAREAVPIRTLRFLLPIESFGVGPLERRRAPRPPELERVEAGPWYLRLRAPDGRELVLAVEPGRPLEVDGGGERFELGAGPPTAGPAAPERPGGAAEASALGLAFLLLGLLAVFGAFLRIGAPAALRDGQGIAAPRR